ncbi:MAG: division/cell wall cluster transcriptional repressor MraZ [Deltaproteobacteria bacterium]|nr:division/cell wall cluster transcriptional repressor MraZ [Deltaproteobacteria bacterium]
MFRGCFEHTIDDKGRLSIPVKFREALDTTFSAPLIVTQKKDCLVAYPIDEWRLLEAKVHEMPTFDPTVETFRRVFLAPAQECPTDKAGRILVPPTQRTFAGLERDVVLAGMGKCFEIWSKERHAAMMDGAVANFDAIAQGMGALGL